MQCLSLCTTLLSYTTQHRAILIIFPLNLQTSITAQIGLLSIGVEGEEQKHKPLIASGWRITMCQSWYVRVLCMHVGLPELTDAALTVPPRNTVAVRGQPAQLTCQTNVSATSSSATSGGGAAATVSWKFTSVGGERQTFIYNDDGLNPAYERRNVSVVVEEDSTGGATTYRLQFDAIQLQDAGTYTCQDDGGVGEPRAAWIAVLGTSVYTAVKASSI